MDDFSEPDTSFSIDAEKASELLGVNRTRLSQLTQKGVLSFERRRVGNRSRLFYRLSDLLAYQNTHTYGPRHPYWEHPQEKPNLSESVSVQLTPNREPDFSLPPDIDHPLVSGVFLEKPSSKMQTKSLASACRVQEQDDVVSLLISLKQQILQLNQELCETQNQIRALEKHNRTERTSALIPKPFSVVEKPSLLPPAPMWEPYRISHPKKWGMGDGCRMIKKRSRD